MIIILGIGVIALLFFVDQYIQTIKNKKDGNSQTDIED